MNNMGRALMGTGIAKGASRARIAAEMAIQSPLLDDISVEGATGVLINVVGGPDLKMKEIQEAASLVQEQAHEDANIIFGASIDESLGENVKVTVIATGFDAIQRAQEQSVAAMSMERPQMTRQPASFAAPQTVPSQQLRALAAQSSTSSRPAAPRETLVPRESSTRQAHNAEARQSQPRLPIRERAQSFPELDHDWDVPAFSRKNQ
jgi:cell division protein FtsZ